MQLANNDYDLKKKYDFRKIAIVRDYQHDLPNVNGIDVQLEQVFMNLLRNAAQALSEYHEIQRTPTIVMRTILEEQHVRIVIEDNGPGMSDDIRRRVFEPFFTTKDPGSGTGLGLSVSYFIITDTHKGSIEVEAEPDVGCRFIIRLPVYQTQAIDIDGSPGGSQFKK